MLVRLFISLGLSSLTERFSHRGTPTLPPSPHTPPSPPSPPTPYLLDHLWMLLHDMQKAVTLLVQGRCPLLGAT